MTTSWDNSRDECMDVFLNILLKHTSSGFQSYLLQYAHTKHYEFVWFMVVHVLFLTDNIILLSHYVSKNVLRCTANIYQNHWTSFKVFSVKQSNFDTVVNK